MSTALVRQQTNVAHLGSRDEIAAVQQRIMTMMPGAKSAPVEVVWAAAQLAVAYRLDPFNGELYIMPVGRKQDGNAWVDDYRTHIGIKGQRKIARRKAEYTSSVREMSADEVRKYRRDDYDPADIGVEFTVYRLDLAARCAQLNVPYTGSLGRGFWRQKAKLNKKENRWEADNIPNTWTAYEVAEKRAEVNALKKAYDMNFDVADPAVIEDEDVIDAIGQKIEDYDRDHAMVMDRAQRVEEDGDILFGVEDVRHRRPQPGPVEVSVTDIDQGTGDMLLSFGEDDGDYVDFWMSAEPPIVNMVESLYAWNGDIHGTVATEKQTTYARKCVELITGPDGFRDFWLSVFGEVDPAPKMTVKTANYFMKLTEHKKQQKEDMSWETVKNPNYDPDAVAMMSAIWQYIKRQTGK